MKNVFTLFLLLCLPFFCQAQLGKGIAALDGFLEINSEVTRLGAEYGGFVSDHIFLGGSINTLYTGNIFFDYLTLGINPYVRYYFNPHQSNTFFYLQANYSYNTFLLDVEGSISNIGLNLGFDHFIAPGVSLNALAGMNIEKYNNVITASNSHSKSLNFTLGLSAFITSATKGEPYSSIGQFRRGSFIIGGSTASLSRSLDVVHWTLNVRPRIGYFITNKLVLGGQIDFSTQKTNSNSIGIFTSRQFGISPFARYYLHYPKRFNPFIAAEVNYESFSVANMGNESNSDRTMIKVGPGGNYFLTPNLAIEGILNVEHSNSNTRLNFNAAVQYFIH